MEISKLKTKSCRVRLAAAGAIFLVAVFPGFVSAAELFLPNTAPDSGAARIMPATPLPDLGSRAYLVGDLDTGQIISEKNSRARLPIASLTKLMTAAVVTENVSLRQTITINKSMLLPFGWTSYLAEGQRLSLGQLLYPMLVESSNDAAQAVSCFLGNKQTIGLMNEKARSLAMYSTNYFDAHGLSPKDVSTARDLFELARYVAKNHPGLLEVTRGKSVGNVDTSRYSAMENKNLVYGLADFAGGKTGYIPESNYNGLFIFKISPAGGPERSIAIIVLGAPHLLAGSHNLEQETVLALNWAKKACAAPGQFALNP